jgi:hypothetical protein
MKKIKKPAFMLFRGGGQGRGRTADLPIFSSKFTQEE